jgi:hypothetical protein
VALAQAVAYVFTQVRVDDEEQHAAAVIASRFVRFGLRCRLVHPDERDLELEPVQRRRVWLVNGSLETVQVKAPPHCPDVAAAGEPLARTPRVKLLAELATRR